MIAITGAIYTLWESSARKMPADEEAHLMKC